VQKNTNRMLNTKGDKRINAKENDELAKTC
jgi:hypothetical protein